MPPDDAECRSRDERAETDASLKAERNKTDTELATRMELLQRDADRVVEVARGRAELTLRAARERADETMTREHASGAVQDEVALERSSEDVALADERAVADEELSAEREERQRALAALLSQEREATDDGLVEERARADEDVATRDDFLGMVSHDLRAMLGGIAFSAATLAKPLASAQPADPATVKQAQRIQRFAARMNRLVGDLLDVVSLEAGKLRVTCGPLDVGVLLDEAADAYEQAFATKGVILKRGELAARTTSAIDGEERLFALGDHDRLLQVLANLLSNALKFTPSGGTVDIRVGRRDDQVRFCVTDSGIGIPASHAEDIFERFRQVSQEDRRRGVGLGLYIAKSIIDAHNGRIWTESPPEGGAAFVFTVPATAAPAGWVSPRR